MNLLLYMALFWTYLLGSTRQQPLRELFSSNPKCTTPNIITQSSNPYLRIQMVALNSTHMAFFWRESDGIWYWQVFLGNGSNTTARYPLTDSHSISLNFLCEVEACYLQGSDTLVVAWKECSGELFFRTFDSRGSAKTSPNQFIPDMNYQYIELACFQASDEFVVGIGKSSSNFSISRYDSSGDEVDGDFMEIANSRNADMVSYENGLLITFVNTNDLQCFVRLNTSLSQMGSIIQLHSNLKSTGGKVDRLNNDSSVICYKIQSQKYVTCTIRRDDGTNDVTTFLNYGDIYFMMSIGNSSFVHITMNSSDTSIIYRRVLNSNLTLLIEDTIDFQFGEYLAGDILSNETYVIAAGIPSSTLIFIIFDPNNSQKRYQKQLCDNNKYFPSCDLLTGNCGCKSDRDCNPKMFCTPSGSCSQWFDIQNTSAVKYCQQLNLNATTSLAPSSLSNYTFSWFVTSTKASASNLLSINSSLSGHTGLNITIPSRKLCDFCDYTFGLLVNNPIGIVYNLTLSFSMDVSFTGSLNSDSYLNWDNSLPLSLTISKTLSDCTNNTFENLMAAKWVNVGGSQFDPSPFVSSNDPFLVQIPGCTFINTNFTKLQINMWFTLNPSKFYNYSVSISIFEDFTVLIRPDIPIISYSSDFVISAESIFKCQPSNFVATYSWSCSNCTQSNCSPCNDGLGLFSQTTNYSLNLPSMYFWQNDNITISVCVSKGNSSKCANKNYLISSQQSFALQLLSFPNPYYFSNQDYKFIAYPPNMNDYTWYTVPPIPSFIFKNQMKVAKNDFIPNGISSIILDIIAVNSTHFGHISLQIPINYPPVNGTFQVNPALGISLSTQFTLITSNWIDDDVPLSYMFCYSVDGGVTYQNIVNDFTSFTSISTILPASASHSIMNLKVIVSDFFGASNELITLANVYSDSNSFLAAITTISSHFDQLVLNVTDPVILKNNIALIFSELSAWENQYTIASGTLIASNGCPVCSGKGQCPIDRCVCNNGWNYLDCSIPDIDFKALINLKLNALDALHSVQNNTIANDSIFTSTLRAIGDNADFNSIETYTKIQDILEDTLNINSPNTILGSQQINDVGEIIDDILQYSSYFDCHSRTYFTQSLTIRAPEYLKTLARSVSASQIASQNASISNKDSYEMYVQKISICDLLSKSIKISSLEPTIQLNLKNSSTADCNQVVNLQIFSLDANLMSCNLSSPKAYTKIALQIIDDSTGTSVNYNVSTTLHFPPNLPMQCPSSCSILDYDCCCDNIGMFDIRNQFVSIFSTSRLATIPNIKALLSYNFVDSIPFWILIGNAVWLVVTIFILSFRLKKYDAFKSYLKSKHKSPIRLISLIFSAIHPLISVYVIYDDEISKRIKAYIYYQRTLVLMVFASIFNTGDNTDDDLLTVSVSFQGVNPYSIILPYLTVVPVFKIIDWLLHFPSPTTIKRCSPKMAFFYRMKLFLGLVFTSLIAVSCNFLVMTVVANIDYSGIRGWTINYIRSILQDIIMTPVIGIFMQFLLLKILKRPKVHRSRFIRKILEFYREPVLEKLMNHSQVIPTHSTQTVPDTEITSPTQTHFSLKKIGTFDFLESPSKDIGTSPKLDSSKKLFRSGSKNSNKIYPMGSRLFEFKEEDINMEKMQQ